MNIVLWVVQVVLSVVFVAAGANHAFNAEKAKTQPGMQWMGAVPKGLLTFIGVVEILGGIGLIVPAATGILPWLTPLAAAGLALAMLLAVGFHLTRREYSNGVGTLVLGVVAILLAVGRVMV
jgi:uncharacterized membrane protein YphA (DoxX/SURF4 family)